MKDNYVVIRNFNIPKLEESVNHLLDINYELVGGIAIDSDENTVEYLQAMIKKETIF